MNDRHLSFDDLPQLDELAQARHRRDDGIADAAAATHDGWRLLVTQTITDLAASGTTFTAEDIRARCGDPLGASDNALGALIAGAARRGEIVAVGHRQATRPEAHGRILRAWRGTHATTTSAAPIPRAPSALAASVDVTSKAMSYLAAGRVTLLEVTPARVVAAVRGSALQPYLTSWSPRWGWRCTCPHLGAPTCCHVVAVQLVTVPQEAHRV